MGNYIRDAKRLSIKYLNTMLEFMVLVMVNETQDKSGMFQMIGSSKTFSFKWSYNYWLKGNDPILYYHLEGKKGTIRTYHIPQVKMARSLIEQYEEMMYEEKGTSPAPCEQIPEEKRAINLPSLSTEEAVQEENRSYSKSHEYRSGIPFIFYLAKIKTWCEGPKRQYYRRTRWDSCIAAMWQNYRDTCRDCKKRGFCSAPCLDRDDIAILFETAANNSHVSTDRLYVILESLEKKAMGN